MLKSHATRKGFVLTSQDRGVTKNLYTKYNIPPNMARLMSEATSCNTLLKSEKPTIAAMITTATLPALGSLLNQVAT
jgi:hypothetical protein